MQLFNSLFILNELVPCIGLGSKRKYNAIKLTSNELIKLILSTVFLIVRNMIDIVNKLADLIYAFLFAYELGMLIIKSTTFGFKLLRARFYTSGHYQESLA